MEGGDGSAIGVGTGRLLDPDDASTFTVALGPGELRPALINAHDHLHRNHYPRLGEPPYADVYDWGEDIHRRWAEDIARARDVPRRDALLFGALKNLLGGVASVVHHDAWEPAFDVDFPLRVVRVRGAHSLGLDPERVSPREGDRGLPFCIHLAEGTTREMAQEVRDLDSRGLVNEGLLAVHAVGVDADGIERLRAAGAAVVWCPSSNEFLYGRTVPPELLDSGVGILLGSDSLLTGIGTLLDELRVARRSGLVDDATLLDAVGVTAAARLALPRPTLLRGAPADLVHLRRPVLGSTAADVALVVVGGVPRLGDPQFQELFERCGVATERLEVGRGVKLVSAPLGRVAERILDDWPEARRIVEGPTTPIRD